MCCKPILERHPRVVAALMLTLGERAVMVRVVDN